MPNMSEWKKIMSGVPTSDGGQSDWQKIIGGVTASQQQPQQQEKGILDSAGGFFGGVKNNIDNFYDGSSADATKSTDNNSVYLPDASGQYKGHKIYGSSKGAFGGTTWYVDSDSNEIKRMPKPWYNGGTALIAKDDKEAQEQLSQIESNQSDIQKDFDKPRTGFGIIDKPLKFLDRSVQSGANMILPKAYKPPTLGNGIADTSSDLLGAVMSSGVNLGGGANTSMNSFGNALTKKVLPNSLSPQVLGNTATLGQKIGVNAIEGAATSLPFSVLESYNKDLDAGETAKTLGLNLLAGGLIGGGIGGVGSGIGKARSKVGNYLSGKVDEAIGDPFAGIGEVANPKGISVPQNADEVLKNISGLSGGNNNPLLASIRKDLTTETTSGNKLIDSTRKMLGFPDKKMDLALGDPSGNKNIDLARKTLGFSSKLDPELSVNGIEMNNTPKNPLSSQEGKFTPPDDFLGSNNPINESINVNQIPNGKNPKIKLMNPDDFDSITHIDDLSDDSIELKSYIAEAARRVKQSQETGQPLKLNLQLFADAQKKLTRFEKNINRFSEVDEVLKNSGNWKDKKHGFQYSSETWDRNPIDVMGEVEGKKFKEAIIDPIHKSEAVSTKMKNDLRGQIKELNLSKQESELVQKLGEGKLSIDELKQTNPNNWEKIQKSVETFRTIYDDLINQSNEVLVRNGYDPVMKRKDYFPHFDGKDGILKELGLNVIIDELPTEISGLTADFRPGKKWFGNFLSRKGDKTTFDAVQGFDKYIEGISRVIHHTDNIQRLRTTIQSLRNKYSEDGIEEAIQGIYSSNLSQEAKEEAVQKFLASNPQTHLNNFVANLESYTNNLAGKKSMADRGIETEFGRKFYGAVDAVKRRVGANMVALNPASWMTNTIPLINAAAENNKGAVLKALNETFRNTDGLIEKSVFLTSRRGSDALSKTAVEKVGSFLTKPFSAIDNFTSAVVTRSKYYDALSKGFSEKEALKMADDWARNTMGGRSLGEQPTLFHQKNPFVAPFTQFQLEVNNQLRHLFKDLPREFDKKKLLSVGTQIAAYGYLYNTLFEQLTGNKPALDPIGTAIDTVQNLTNDKMSKSSKATNITKDLIKPIPFIGGLVGGGRLPISAAIPDPTKFTSAGNVAKELSKPLTYVVPPFGGGQIKKTIEGISTVASGGAKDSNGKRLYKVEKTLPNYAKAAILGKSSLKEVQNYYNKTK